MKSNDKGRMLKSDGTPRIDYLIWHHTTGDEGKNYFDSAIRAKLNSVGFSRGYAGNGYDFKTGISSEWGTNRKKLVSGEIGYAEYHATIHAYDLDKDSPYFQKGGYRVVPLLEDPENCDAGSTKSRETNRRALAFSICNNFEINQPEEEFVQWLINQFRSGGAFWWVTLRYPQIKHIGHRDVEPTACPGKYFYSLIDRIAEEYNNIAKEIIS